MFLSVPMFRDGKGLRNEKSKVGIRSKTFDNEALFLECSFYGMEGNVLNGFVPGLLLVSHPMTHFKSKGPVQGWIFSIDEKRSMGSIEPIR